MMLSDPGIKASAHFIWACSIQRHGILYDITVESSGKFLIGARIERLLARLTAASQVIEDVLACELVEFLDSSRKRLIRLGRVDGAEDGEAPGERAVVPARPLVQIPERLAHPPLAFMTYEKMRRSVRRR
jgi:hypothetical protein